MPPIPETQLPAYAPLPRFCGILGLGRTTVYALAASGKLRLVKCGGRTLGDVPHALDYMRSLPAAQLTPARAARAQAAEAA